MVYRIILMIVSVLSLAVAGLSEIRNSLILTIGLMNLCMWTLPLVQKWKKQRDANSLEGERQLGVGNYAEAERSLVLAVADTQRQKASPAKRAAILMNLAEAQRKQVRLGPSEESILQAMVLVVDAQGQGREQYGRCLEALGQVYHDSGNYPQEQQALQESLSVEEGLPKPDAARLAKRRHKLALAYHQSGDHAAASSHFTRSLELHEKAFGADHAETGKMLTELGSAQHREGNHTEALRNLERALAIQEKTLGADSLEVTNSVYQLALAFEKSGNLERAAAQFEHMLQLRERQVGGSEADLADAYSHLSRLYFSLGRLARAEETAQSAILILERAPGMELAYILERLSAIYQRADRHVEAAKVLARAKEVRKAFGGGSREAKA